MKSYICIECGEMFEDDEKYQKHTCSPHDKACTECNKLFPTNRRIEQHMKEVHNVPMHVYEQTVVSCSVCEFSTENHPELKAHIQANHKATIVLITSEDQSVINCEKCDLNLQ